MTLMNGTVCYSSLSQSFNCTLPHLNVTFPSDTDDDDDDDDVDVDVDDDEQGE